jgi:hypothetical protein
MASKHSQFRAAADAAVDDELARILGYVRIELFISIRSGASVNHDFADNVVPRGARITRSA